METIFDNIISKLMDDGYPRDLIVRYINACIKNCHSDESIMKDLNDRFIPKEFKENAMLTKAYIDTFMDATVLAEAIEVLPLTTKEAIDLINKKRKFIE